MSFRRANTVVSLVVLLTLLIQPLAVGAAAPTPQSGSSLAPTPATAQPGQGFLFRASVTLAGSRNLARLEKVGVLVLGTSDDNGKLTALVLADGEQLADLARLGFRPQVADELRLLVSAQGPEKAWLMESLQPLLAQADAVVALQAVAGAAGVAAAPDATAEAVALQALRTSLQALTPEQIAGMASSASIDDDADGLTNTEELWWCTDPLNPNSDGDANGYADGQEVAALLDFTLSRTVRWGYGPPFGPPAAWPNYNNRDGTGIKVCNDGDKDSIPDYAEVYMVGTRVPEESTDHDKFDDGQELFGTTFCPGDAPNPCWGILPAGEYWNFIPASMPNWVLPPGDNPLVAAFPVPEVYVTPGSWHVERVTTITTSQGAMTQTSNTYETSVMRGQGTSIADTVMWNSWEETSQAVETPLIQQMSTATAPNFDLGKFLWGGTKLLGGAVGTVGAAGATVLGGVACPETLGAACLVAIGGTVAAPVTYDVAKSGWQDIRDSFKKDEIQNQYPVSKYSITNVNNLSSSATANASVVLNQVFDFQGVAGSLDGVQYAINRQGDLLARGLQDVSYQLSRPRLTETRTSGHSWGGEQTTTQEEYEEHSISEGQAFTTGQNWSTAWAVDSSHAADLTFEFTVKNTGTEYARELSGIVVNVYIGDDTSPAISYPAWEKFPNGKLENLFPVGPNTPPGQFSERTFTTNPITLTLEQMKRIDLGERLTVKVESYSFGADELFYTNAVTGGVTVFIEDGVEDGDETVDSYVIPTWGVENIQDVLTRYFRCPSGQTCTDADGNLNALWTPEYDGINPPTWHEHYLSDIAWWNVYLTQADAGDTSLHDLPAQAGSGILFRFNRDSDRDGYNDRAEFRYYCALPASDPDRAHCSDGHLRADIHPQPEVSAGYVTERSGNVVTVKLAVENTGTFDAYGIDAVMYSPDGTTTIGNNTVGGNGRIRPGNHVAVGSLIKPPDLANWGASTAKPYAGGQFSGAVDRTFTFTAATPGVVGQGATAMTWSDGAGGSGSISLGSSYHAPLPVEVVQGLQIGLNTGTIATGARFTVPALTSRDTFTYTVVSEPFTPPVIAVSYSDPQGSHRFVTPVVLPSLNASIAAGQMLEGLQVEVVTPAAFNVAGANTTHLVVNNPHPATIQGGHLYLNFVSDGVLVLEKPYTLDIPAGPTVFPADWSVTEFSADYHPDGDNILIAFWTDSEGNIIDSAARPFNSFAADPKPAFAMTGADAIWDFGTAAQGTILKRSFTFANTGALDLLTYVSGPAGLTVSQTGSRRVSPADMTTYEMALNTANLAVGPYDGTITIRTSDPDNPARTVHVMGTITAMPADTPVGAMQRPLDWPATVSGTQGQWVEFAHTLGPEPSSLHPVKVYSQDYAALKGVGKYATPFSSGTAPGDMFGDGRDGVMPSSGNLDSNTGVGVGIVNSGVVGTYSINVTDAYAGWRINIGDVVLIHQTQGTGAGCWELNKAASDYTGGTAAIQLTRPLQCNYTNGGSNHAQIQRVPQYTDCPVSGSVIPLTKWNGSWGGILAIMCNGTMNLTGSISVTGYGFRGGPKDAPVNTLQQGYQGEGYPGYYSRSTAANGNGGGGGADQATPDRKSGGGGGGNGTAGTPGQAMGGNVGGAGGGTSGNAALTNWIFGGAGGQGAYWWDGSGTVSPMRAGSGGGILFVSSRLLQATGTVTANGENGSNAAPAGGGNGGGAGGSILIRGQSVSLGTLTSAIGGTGGTSADPEEGYGGSGGVGRIRVEYCNSVSGIANPSASIQQLNCWITEQVESSPYDRTRLNLPASGTNTYQVQYGRKLNWSTATTRETTLRVPAGLFTAATLQALISDLPSNAAFSLDVGATGTPSWSGTVSNNSENTSPNLAAYFNTYSASHGRPTTGYLDVPVRVTLDRAGQVLLTNLKVTPTGSKLRYIRLPVRPLGYSSVTASFTVSGGSGPLAVGVDVGANGSVEWTYTGSPTYPASLVTGDLATAVAAYLAGKSGEVDVPIRFYLAPFATLNLTGFSATPTGQPNAQVGASDVSFSATSPTEGEEVTVTALLHNPGSLDTGPIVASFVATATVTGQPQGLPLQIGNVFVPNVPAGGTAQAEIQWNTFGFTGVTPVCVTADPFNRLAESSETNNQATASLTIKTRPDLRVAAIALSDTEPVVGQVVTATLTLHNNGQTGAGPFTIDLYDGNPASGGMLVQALDVAALAGGTSSNLLASWTPAAPGEHRLFVEVDPGLAVNEYAEDNNETWDDVYVGLAGPILIDSGGGDAYDPPYSPENGFGYLDGETSTFCGDEPDKTQRSDYDAQLQYRFDHLLPGHFYHLDVTLFECDGTGRQEKIAVDDNVIEPLIDLADGAVHRLSYLLDPAFYADRSVLISIAEIYGNDVVVSEVNLYHVDYRYSDAGGGNDPAYSLATGCGWLDGVAQTSWGTLPYQSRRTDIPDSNPDDDPDNELRYRYDRLDPARRYQLHATVYQGAGTGTVIESIAVDDVDTGTTITVVGVQRRDVTFAIPPGTYASDRSIVVRIIRTNASANAFVNLIALEELTLSQGGDETQNLTLHGTSPNWISFNIKPPVRPALYCAGVTATSAFTILAGDALLAGAAAPVNSLVEAYTPAGVKVGCHKVTTAGQYGYMRVYGAEGATPGMAPGEPVQLKINGIASQPSPYPVIWQNDKLTRDVDLAAADVIPVETFLDPIAGRVVKLQSETGTYLPPPADPRFNTTTTVAPGWGYLLYTNAAATLAVTGDRIPADTPLALHAGWNWLGYLPTCELPVATALTGIAGRYDLLHNEVGTYRPPPANPAYNTFNTMAPGKGYMIHMTAAATLTYPATGCGAAAGTEPGAEPIGATPACPAVATGVFTHYYGAAMNGDRPMPAGAVILAYSPRGEVVGCGAVQEGGLYPYLRVYGAKDAQPGLQPGEAVHFTVDGRLTQLSAAAIWQNDWDVYPLDLEIGGSDYYLPLIVR